MSKRNCPVCSLEVDARGYNTHMRYKHGIDMRDDNTAEQIEAAKLMFKAGGNATRDAQSSELGGGDDAEQKRKRELMDEVDKEHDKHNQEKPDDQENNQDDGRNNKPFRFFD